jgi:hypothetical protein
MAYRVFVRNWWRRDSQSTFYHDGVRVTGDPGARKYTIAKRIQTEEEAQRIAQEYNATHKPGPLSRKAEYDDE